MATNRLFYTIKFTSSFLKEYKYNINLTFEQCLNSGFVISLSDSQMLKSIRDITHHTIDRNLLESYYQERDRLKKSKNLTAAKRARVSDLQSKIYNMMYMPEYITVQMESLSDYEHMYKRGFTFNGRTYRRGSCSASQARVSTIVFIDTTVLPELSLRLNNDRDLSHPLAPTKFNAYYGLYSSASLPVSKPRFCIIPDFSSTIPVDVDWSIETDWDKDDIIEPRTLDLEFNRFDGSGMISPSLATQWAQDLQLDYVPSQFCIRTAFTKGLVNVFDFHLWCQDEPLDIPESDRFLIKDIYGETVDLRNIDVILTEGMAKLYDSWPSQAAFESACTKNGIDWRVTKYAPKQDKEVGLTNYQYLQTLNPETLSIPSLCKDTIQYIEGVTYDDPYYSLLFMMGDNMDSVDADRFLRSSDNYWLKSCILNHSLLNDRYSREKLRDMIVRRIEQACLGRLLMNGNYQAIVPDNYALMEWIVYRDPSRVKGLLKDGEFYSQFWANKSISKIACARSPMTAKGEWVIADNKYTSTDGKIEKYFKYSYSGIITNIHGQYTMNFAGSDFDFDIMYTTSSPDIINNTYYNAPGIRVTAYDVPKPKKKPNLTDDDLYLSDTFSFGQQIGPLTNTVTSIYALLPLFDPSSPEAKLLEKRIQMGCVAQSKQIDKTKIGQAVKCIPKVWITRQKASPDDTPSQLAEKNFYNSLLCCDKPYFFKYKYKQLDKDIRDYVTQRDENCQKLFAKSLQELRDQQSQGIPLTSDESYFLQSYYYFYPAIDTPCTMNNICKYIESIDFHIKQRIRGTSDFDYKTLQTPSFTPNTKLYNEIKSLVESEFKSWQERILASKQTKVEKTFAQTSSGLTAKMEKDLQIKVLKSKLSELIPNEQTLTNYLIQLFYVDHPGYSRSTLWSLVGKQIYDNIKSNTSSYYFPVQDPSGTLKFLYENYSIQKLPVPIEEDPDILNYDSLIREIGEE